MRRGLVWSLAFIIGAAVVGLGATIAAGHKPLLGLDLRGGVSVVLRPDTKAGTSTLQSAVSIIDRRVNELGVANSNVARQGNDIVIGGTGADKVVGSSGEDVVIGASTDYDNNVTALQALLAEWGSSGTFPTRVSHLRTRYNGRTTGRDGSTLAGKPMLGGQAGGQGGGSAGGGARRDQRLPAHASRDAAARSVARGRVVSRHRGANRR